MAFAPPAPYRTKTKPAAPACQYHRTGGFCIAPCVACDDRIDTRRRQLAERDARTTNRIMRARPAAR